MAHAHTSRNEMIEHAHAKNRMACDLPYTCRCASCCLNMRGTYPPLLERKPPRP